MAQIGKFDRRCKRIAFHAAKIVAQRFSVTFCHTVNSMNHRLGKARVAQIRQCNRRVFHHIVQQRDCFFIVGFHKGRNRQRVMDISFPGFDNLPGMCFGGNFICKLYLRGIKPQLHIQHSKFHI